MTRDEQARLQTHARGVGDSNPLRFLVLVTNRQYRPMKGFTEPNGPLCFVRAVPGNVIAWASTEEQAIRNLHAELDREMGTQPREWYSRQLKVLPTDQRLTESIRQQFRDLLAGLVTPTDTPLETRESKGVPLSFSKNEAADELLQTC